MNLNNLPDYHKLSIPEKIILLENMWDEISARESEIPLPESHKLELKDREEKYNANPGKLLSLEELISNIDKKK